MRRRVFDFSTPGSAPCLFDSLREAQSEQSIELARVQEDFARYIPHTLVQPAPGGYVNYTSAEPEHLVRGNGLLQSVPWAPPVDGGPYTGVGRLGSTWSLQRLQVRGTIVALGGTALRLNDGFINTRALAPERRLRVLLFAALLPAWNTVFPDLSKFLVPAPRTNASDVDSQGAQNSLWSPYQASAYNGFLPLYDSVVVIPTPKVTVLQEQNVLGEPPQNWTQFTWDDTTVHLNIDVSADIPIHYSYDDSEGGSESYYPDIGLFLHIQEYQPFTFDYDLPQVVAQGVVTGVFRP